MTNKSTADKSSTFLWTSVRCQILHIGWIFIWT